jgi:hypothetical protein
MQKMIWAGLCLSTLAYCQTAEISGDVRDASGLAVPGAEVKVTQTATGVSRPPVPEATVDTFFRI